MREHNSMENIMRHNFLATYPAYMGHVIDYYLWTSCELRLDLDDGRTALWNERTQSGSFYSPGDWSIDDKKTFDFEFGYRLETLMRNKGYGVIDVAEGSGMDPNTIYRYIRGERSPTLYSAVRLAKALHCSVDDLLKFVREFK